MTEDAIEIWLRFDGDAEEAEAEATVHLTRHGYRVDWSLTAVGLIRSHEFDTLSDTYDWLQEAGYENYTC